MAAGMKEKSSRSRVEMVILADKAIIEPRMAIVPKPKKKTFNQKYRGSIMSTPSFRDRCRKGDGE